MNRVDLRKLTDGVSPGHSISEREQRCGTAAAHAMNEGLSQEISPGTTDFSLSWMTTVPFNA